MSDIKPTMTLVTSHWSGIPTFRMIPASPNAPFEEVIYDPTSKALVLLSRYKKNTFHMVPILDDHGDAMKVKHMRANKKEFREQRITQETLPEHYVTVPEEINHVISLHAENASSFDFMKYINAPLPTAQINEPMETPTAMAAAE